MKHFVLPMISGLLYLSCLAAPAILFEKVCEGSNPKDHIAGLWQTPNGTTETRGGMGLLLLGAIGVIVMQWGALSWLANPLYLLALIAALVKLTLVARISIIAALGFALVSLHLTNWSPLLADEGEVCYLSAIRPLPGHWLWLAAMVTLAMQVWLPALST